MNFDGENVIAGGRNPPLNLEADARPGDPTASSNPDCWICGPMADALKTAFSDRVRAIQTAPRYHDDEGVLRIDDAEVESLMQKPTAKR